jgi:hypothetical protein
MNYTCLPENFSKAIALSDSQKELLVAVVNEAREGARRGERPLFTRVKEITKKRSGPTREVSFIL